MRVRHAYRVPGYIRMRTATAMVGCRDGVFSSKSLVVDRVSSYTMTLTFKQTHVNHSIVHSHPYYRFDLLL